jgi:hypothetical protein
MACPPFARREDAIGIHYRKIDHLQFISEVQLLRSGPEMTRPSDQDFDTRFRSIFNEHGGCSFSKIVFLVLVAIGSWGIPVRSLNTLLVPFWCGS